MAKQKSSGWLDKYQNGGWTASPKVAAYNKAAKQTPTNIDANAMQAFEQVTSYPQRKITEWISGTNQYPSQAMGIQNPYGAFAVDAVADPVNLIGAGLLGKAAKASGKLSKASKIAKAASKGEDAIKLTRAAVPNPLALLDQFTPRLDPIKAMGIEMDIMDLSPLNLIPGYGKKLSGKNQTFRKFGNSLDDVIQRQALSPAGGSDVFRMGKDQIVSEGNWAARNQPSENYPGVFEATFDMNNPNANLSALQIPDRNGVLMVDRAGRRLPEIPLTEPGMSFNRRLPFSTRYVPIDKTKLMNNQFQLATQLPHVQSLAEKYGLYAGGAGLYGYMRGGEEGAKENIDFINRYTVDPVLDVFKGGIDKATELLPKKKNGGWLEKYDEGGTVAAAESTGTVKPGPVSLMTDEQKRRLARREQMQRAHDVKELAKTVAKSKTYISATPNMTAELKSALSEDQKRNEYIANSPLAQTFTSMSGGNEALGSIAAKQFPYTVAAGASAMVGPEALPFLRATGAALNQPIAGVAGLTANNLLNAGFAYEAGMNLPNVAESFKEVGRNPTIGNVANAAGEVGLTALGTLPFAAEVAPGVKAAIDASKESGLLSNAYKINPLAYKPGEGMMYRGLGEEGFKDALESGVFRAKQNVEPFMSGRFDIAKRFGTNPYFTPRFKTAESYGSKYLAEVPESAANWRQRYARTDWSQVADRAIPINEGRILQKDWLQGYKPIEMPEVTGLSQKPVGNIFTNLFKKFETVKNPELTDENTLSVLEDFKQRIQTPEGQRRLKEIGLTNDKALQQLKILEDNTTYAHYTPLDNDISFNPELVTNPFSKNIVRHEIEHAVQAALKWDKWVQYNNDIGNLKYLFRPRAKKQAWKEIEELVTPVDKSLADLELKRIPNKVDWDAIKESKGRVKDPNKLFDYITDEQNATDYFDSGSEGLEKGAFLAEVQQYMLDNNYLKHPYDDVSVDKVKEVFKNAANDKEGVGKYLRIFNIMKPTEKNYSLIAEGLNKMLSAPTAVATGAAALSLANQPEQKKNGGWLDKYNDGGPVQPNYNDASVTYSPDFVGDGYNTKGRNYSPAWGGQFEDGGNLPNAKDGWLETLKSTLNPHNWGVSDYSNKGNFNSAYELARKAGEKEFMWNNKRYSTNMKGTPSQQLQWSGITNDRLGIQGPLEKRAYLSVRPGVYGNANEETSVTTVGHLKNFIKGYDRFDQNKTNEGYKEVEKEYQAGNLEKAKRLNDELTYYKDYSGEDDAYSEDAWQMYLGMPQKKSSFSISKYKPTKGKNQNVNYYSLPDEFKQDLLNSYISGNIKVGLNDEFALPSERSEGPHSGTSKGRVLGNFTVGKGKDEKGEYISYYDKYDLSTTLPVVGEVSVDQFVGKPFEIYDRIYLDPKTGKPKMAMGGSMPGAVGFTYARTIGPPAPSKGPRGKKTVASAQNGIEMKYYQQGLDWKPKSISKNGSKIIKDDRGQWAHPGKVTKIGSNQITMQGVPYPVLGISDTGDMQMMYPNQEYNYDGSSVTEYPMMAQGGQLTKLDQLTNFTNYNTKQPGGWLDKYQ